MFPWNAEEPLLFTINTNSDAASNSVQFGSFRMVSPERQSELINWVGYDPNTWMLLSKGAHSKLQKEESKKRKSIKTAWTQNNKQLWIEMKEARKEEEKEKEEKRKKKEQKNTRKLRGKKRSSGHGKEENDDDDEEDQQEQQQEEEEREEQESEEEEREEEAEDEELSEAGDSDVNFED